MNLQRFCQPSNTNLKQMDLRSFDVPTFTNQIVTDHTQGSLRAHQEQPRLAVRARQAWLAASPGSLDTLGCTHCCCREPRMHTRDLQHRWDRDMQWPAIQHRDAVTARHSFHDVVPRQMLGIVRTTPAHTKRTAHR